MSLTLKSFEIGNLISSGERTVATANFTDINRQMGIGAAIVTHLPFAYGKISGPGVPFREFFYDSSGRVIKKFYFDPAGAIEAKKIFSFKKDKDDPRPLSTKIIRDDEIVEEEYSYDDKGRLTVYTLRNPKWPAAKVDRYEYDRFGRKNRKVSYGLIGEPYLITHYLYDSESATDRKATYRHVTTPEGALVLTILWTYDRKKEKQTGMYSFYLEPDEITALRKSDEQWELYSFSRSLWGYDSMGNHTDFTSDAIFTDEWNNILEEKNNPQAARVVTEKYSNEYEKLPNGKNYLVRTTEWLTLMDEPLKAVKQYQYFDKAGKTVYQPVAV